MFGMPSQILTGIDYYDAAFHQNRGAFKGLPPIHIYDLSQQTLAGYWQHTVGLLPTTDFAYGARVQNTTPECPGSARPQCARLRPVFQLRRSGPPAGQQRNQLCAAYRPRASLQQRVLGVRPRRARVPHAERRGAGGFRARRSIAFFDPIPGDFRLKTQTSHDIEGGFRIKSGGFQMQSSIYSMELENEIHFIPALFFNVNLDPTRRYGSETSASLRVSDSLLLRGGAAYTRAIFREGPFAGNDVPLVSRYTAMGGVTWNIWQNYLVLDATLRAWSERFMDNDQGNTQRRIPADATVDLKLSGAYEHFFWSIGVNNLFNALYYDYADRQQLHARTLLGLSAARPDLHGEGRRDVLNGKPVRRHAGPACPDLTRRYSPWPMPGECLSMPVALPPRGRP